ncbi:tRNA pseudouridine synthase B [Segatella asaccharophila]|jgi:tRNA pseudouridine55 synthase
MEKVEENGKIDFLKGAIFAIDKPYRISSFGALAHVRYLLKKRLHHRVKIGHAGTLDPLATGVLVLCTGKMTKQIERLQQGSKEYVATLQLGATTPSYDREQTVDHTFPTLQITRDRILTVLESFTGDILQTPPSYSAVKIKGDRAYELRRAGKEVVLQPKPVHIDRIELMDFYPETMQMTIRVVCGKGTYIRALARDVGRKLDSGAFLTSLRRTRSSGFSVADCVDFDHIDRWLEEVTEPKDNELENLLHEKKGEQEVI